MWALPPEPTPGADKVWAPTSPVTQAHLSLSETLHKKKTILLIIHDGN